MTGILAVCSAAVGAAGWLLACVVVVCTALTLVLGSGAAASAPSFAAAPLADPSGPSVVLNAVSCSSATACTAVGEMSPNANSSRVVPVAERWNGTSWSIEPMPGRVHAELGGSSLTVSCPSSTTCFAAWVNTVELWDGRSWSIQRTPRVPGVPPGGVLLRDVSCSSAIACTAVGEVVLGREPACSHLTDGCRVRPLAERWNGRRWSVQQTAKHVQGEFVAVSCPSKRACFAVGTQQPRQIPDPNDLFGVEKGALAERWNGSFWSREPIPSGGYFAHVLFGFVTGLSCVSASACLAVGSWDNENDYCSNQVRAARASNTPPVTSCGGGLMWRWNESGWSLLRVKGGGGPLSCATATWCVENWGTGMHLWNGVRWERQPPSIPLTTEVNDVSCISPTACVAVGDKPAPGNPFFTPTTAPLALIWNGTSWIDRSPPYPTTTPMIH
jgi:hypothetical protein